MAPSSVPVRRRTLAASCEAPTVVLCCGMYNRDTVYHIASGYHVTGPPVPITAARVHSTPHSRAPPTAPPHCRTR
eukprot:1663082-Pyramimonas_sp.AAC.3